MAKDITCPNTCTRRHNDLRTNGAVRDNRQHALIRRKALANHYFSKSGDVSLCTIDPLLPQRPTPELPSSKRGVSPDRKMQLSTSNISKAEVKDGYHLGNLLMDFFNNGTEDHLWQIDAGTGESELKSSVKFRSIQLARCLRNAGLKPGDVVAVSGVNHLDVHIPFYASYLNGHSVIGIDPVYKYDEIKILIQRAKPKLAFCEASSLGEYEKVVKDLGLDTKLVTFGGGEESFKEFIKKYDDNAPEHEFRVATFDTNKIYAWLISTSGTSGPPKVAAFKHSTILAMVNVLAMLKQKELVVGLNQSSVQWITGYMASLYMIYGNQIKVQTSSPFTIEHAIDIINKYKPAICTSSPLLFNKILKHEKYCDLTCLRIVTITAFPMNPTVFQTLKTRIHPDGILMNMLGQTECLGALLMPAPNGPVGNVGTELPVVKVQLVDPSNGELITKPNTVGELWTKGPSLTEYYQNPEATAATFSPDGWFKTGDLVYKDENGYYFYVERMSSSFRVGNYFVIPKEIEFLLKEHPEVEEACVVDIPDPEYNKQTVAVVQLQPGSTLTEQQIKDIVAEKLSIHKHLHGGVLFVDNFPRTFSEKIARGKVKDYVLEHHKSRVSVLSELPCSGNTKKLITTFQRLTSTEFVTTYQRLGSTEHVRYISTGTH